MSKYIECHYCQGTGKDFLDENEACRICKGTGKLVKHEQTNEEWFCQLPTEEKAKFFHGIVIRAMQATWDGKKPDYPAYLSDWKMWLKEVHE
jgi:RecJ-like exonuclease